MATPTITSDLDPIVQQVRDCSLLLASVGSISHADIRRYLNEHAFPRVHGLLLAARTENAQGNGALLFMESLPAMADASAASAAQQLVNDVMLRPMIKDWCYTAAAAFAAGHIVQAKFGQVPEQEKLSAALYERAMKDINFLIKSPLLTTAIAETLAAQEKLKVALPRIYVCLDVDPATASTTASTIRPYQGAQESGMATVWVGVNSVSTPVNPGDQPTQILQRLAAAMRALYASNVNVPNVVLGPNEGPRMTVSRTIKTYDLNNTESSVTYAVTLNLSYMEFNAHRYDDTVDAWFATLELRNEDGQLGIRGLLYGDSNVYDNMTNLGPYSVLIDLDQSKTGTTAVAPDDTENLLTQDTFWFVVDAPLTEPGILRYQSGNRVSELGRDPYEDPIPREVHIPAGANAMDVVMALARDMQAQARLTGLLPGVRSPVRIEVMGSEMTAPGVRIVPWRASRLETKLLFDILEVPIGVRFGVLPPTLVTNSAFDEGPKSLVLEPYFVAAAFTASGGEATSPGLSSGFSASAVPPVFSDRLNRLNRDLRFFGGTRP